MSSEKITAIILAGGASRRMGNLDKAWCSYQGKPLIQHVIDTIEPQVNHVIISCGESSERFQSLPYRYCIDTEAGFQGPLKGITSCADSVNTDYVFVVPCDMPLLPSDIVQHLKETLGDNLIALPNDGIRDQHLVFLCKAQAIDSIRDYLESGAKSVVGWITRLTPVIADFSANAEAFLNVNTSAQLR
ncbi:MAG TPA: molybdenum cofactor guanylyltransferase [Gammaproteobacteria bacterium]|nr:molybdenum cofactor guanylyltransferase [Gammaproteobacteria bacterium]